jgi:hypothetical protein
MPGLRPAVKRGAVGPGSYGSGEAFFPQGGLRRACSEEVEML